MNPFVGRLITGMLLFSAVWTPAAADGKRQPDPALLHTDSVLAVVGDYLITTHDVTSTTQLGESYLAMKYQDRVPEQETIKALEGELLDYRHEVARDLVSQAIVYNEFTRRGFVLPEGIIMERLAQVATERAGGSLERFEQWLTARNTSLEEYKNRLRRQIAVELLVAREVDHPILIAPQEVQAFYDNHQDLFRIPSRVTLHILSIPAKDVDPAMIDAKLSEIFTALEEGMAFDQVVLKHSTGFNREQGGLLPELEFAKMNPEYQQAVGDLKPGQVSKPFLQNEMINLLYVKDLVPGERMPFDQVRTRIENMLKQRERAWRYRDYVRRLRRRSYTRIYFKEED